MATIATKIATNDVKNGQIKKQNLKNPSAKLIVIKKIASEAFAIIKVYSTFIAFSLIFAFEKVVVIGISYISINAENFLKMKFYEFNKSAMAKMGYIYPNSEYVEYFNQFKPDSFKNIKECRVAFPTTDCKDSVERRNELIKIAKHNIIVSGNYCGGKAFSDFLDLIETQMTKEEKLKTVILSSPNFLSKENEEKIKELEEKFNDRFYLIKTHDGWMVNGCVKKITNHTKCTIVDFGKAFMLGGSGIKDNFAKRGLDKYEKEDNEKSDSKGDSEYEKIFNKILPGSFRDMDFVFYDDKNSSGRKVYDMMIKLCRKYEEYNKLLGRYSEYISKKEKILKELAKVEENFVTENPLKDKKTEEDCKVQLFFTGPELSGESIFLKKLVKRVNAAKKSIQINHMYIHPPKVLMDALIVAANRGVKVTIITNGVQPDNPQNTPSSHKLFGPWNKYSYLEIYKALDAKTKNNLEVYEFEQRKKGNHKKVVVIDEEYVIAGSGNMGTKSLVTASDDEINFIARGAKFSKETLKIFETDIEHSRRIFPLREEENFPKFSNKEYYTMVGNWLGRTFCD